jgi:hypothetical protein
MVMLSDGTKRAWFIHLNNNEVVPTTTKLKHSHFTEGDDGLCQLYFERDVDTHRILRHDHGVTDSQPSVLLTLSTPPPTYIYGNQSPDGSDRQGYFVRVFRDSEIRRTFVQNWSWWMPRSHLHALHPTSVAAGWYPSTLESLQEYLLPPLVHLVFQFVGIQIESWNPNQHV